MAAWRTLDDMPDVRAKRVLVRLDLNVPVKDGEVSDATRIERSAPTVRTLRERGARIVLCSHFGRPKNGPDEANSLRQIVPALDAHFKTKVAFASDCIGTEAEKASAVLKDGEVLLLENTRFHAGEEKNDAEFAAGLAASGDLYVDDAFSMAHRAHASNVGVAKLLPAYAGRSMAAELNALESVLGAPKRPVLAIVGGSKVSTKIGVLTHLLSKVDTLAIGGAMANTFVAAQGTQVGKSLEERDQHEVARDILANAKSAGCRILLPSDGVVATELKAGVPTRTVSFAEIAEGEMVLDIGAASVQAVKAALAGCATLLWNGPVGAFEIPPFGEASFAIAREVKGLTKSGKLVSVAGGGDTVAALEAADAADGFTYVSTAGGAFLEWLEGKPLPGVVALIEAAERAG